MKHIIGSISSATMNPDHLIPRFLAALGQLDPEKAERFNKDHVIEDMNDDEFLDRLFDLLGEYAPPYFYFGAHEGDCADYGFWLCAEALDDFDGLKVGDLAEVPADYTGEALVVNDHGNTSLYSVVDGKATEVWSLV